MIPKNIRRISLRTFMNEIQLVAGLPSPFSRSLLHNRHIISSEEIPVSNHEFFTHQNIFRTKRNLKWISSKNITIQTSDTFCSLPTSQADRARRSWLPTPGCADEDFPISLLNQDDHGRTLPSQDHQYLAAHQDRVDVDQRTVGSLYRPGNPHQRLHCLQVDPPLGERGLRQHQTAEREDDQRVGEVHRKGKGGAKQSR